MEGTDLLVEAIRHSLIDKEIDFNINSTYQVNLIDNQKQPLLDTIRKLIVESDEFYISVAFLMSSGIRGIKMELEKAALKNTPVKIIVGNMNNFSDPRALEELNEFDNIDIKLNMDNNLHTKGYFFKKDDVWTIVVGSSNLTQAALKSNKEWNIIINSLDNGKLVENALSSFNNLWNNSNDLSESINQYSDTFNQEKHIRQQLAEYRKQLVVYETIQPNLMQVNALEKLSETRQYNNDKALIISATGSGKTYLAALDVKQVKPKRLLFIVHRENIVNNAMKSFRKIINDVEMGEFVGSRKNKAPYLFATIQTISKDEYLHSFNKDDFDYIIIDEVHRAGAITYQKILNYFTPKFLLGLTATPERSDDFNIYELFNYNVPYEIRLNEAIDNDIIVPFHYYGVSEIKVNNEIVEEKTKIDPYQRALNIKEKSNFYKYDGDKVHGLIFVDKIDNAKELAVELNNIGYKTIALTGEDSESKRVDAITMLQEKDLSKDYLDFIISVDIFNEGIDIPAVNQVLLLRPTKSVIVYIQQLGRGLRKAYDKNYLVILDFIGNYKNNFLIPVALSGDATYDVDFLNRFVTSGTSYVPGSCTINFEDVPRKLILDKIEKKKFTNKKIIQQDYLVLKQRLNRTPLLCDFYDNRMISPEFILAYKKTYPEVLLSIDNEYKINFSESELTYLRYLYQEFNMVKRVHEILIIKHLLKPMATLENINQVIEDYLEVNNQIDNTNNALDHLKKTIFVKDNTRVHYQPLIVNDELVDDFKDSYVKNYEFKKLVDDYLKFNLKYNKDHYLQTKENTMIIGRNYSRKEAFHLMNLDYHAGNQVGGYTVINEKKKVLIFMKADKSSYSNEIINSQEIVWFSKSNRTLNKSVNETLIAKNELELDIFIKKEGGEKEYYFGKAKVVDYIQTQMNNKPIIKYRLKLDIPIDEQLFDYFKF